MSDLDADLYGDLYGNDETEFAGDAKDLSKQELEEYPEDDKPEQEQPPAPAAPSSQAPVRTQAPQQATSATQQPQAVQTYTSSSETQQIPTYQERTEYNMPSPPRSQNGSGQYIPVSEHRSVRPSEMKDEGKMFIGGLNWDTTDETLRNYFSQFGKVDACTIMRDAAGRSRCFAFLTFEDPASVNAVMVREHVLDGKIIDPKRAIPRQEHQRATKLFIGGLAGSVTSESMREFFSQFGKVIDSTVMLDRETGRSKGFGFVSFEDADVTPILGFGKLEIDGKMIDVKLAEPRYKRDFGGHSEGGSGGGGGGRGNYSGGGGGNYGGQGSGGYNAQSSPPVQQPAPGGSTPFDPQALAALYTRMFQMTGGGMNPMMAGGMNPMMGGMGGMMGGMGMGAGAGMGMNRAPMAPGGMGAAAMGGAAGMGMGRGAGMGAMPGMMQGGGMGGNIPRGPRGFGPGGPSGQQGVGPQRTGQRGQHGYHPYARG